MEFKNINIRNLYIDLLNKIKNVEGVDKDYVDGLIEVIDYHLTALDTDLSAIESVIPESASVSNPLATEDDIPPAQVNSDWNATSGVARILNKPTIKRPVTRTINVSASAWSQPTGADYWRISYSISDNFDINNAFLVNLVPVSPALEPTAAQKAAYDLVFHSETYTIQGNTSVRLFAREKPNDDFTIDILYFTAF